MYCVGLFAKKNTSKAANITLCLQPNLRVFRGLKLLAFHNASWTTTDDAVLCQHSIDARYILQS
jgi:hypothetical protein